jgi:hypothetical protein
MYVTAHRIRTRLHEDGINAYYYMHGSSLWREAPDPEQDPGTLVNTLHTVDTLGGNHVSSFLDVVAPDEMSWSDIESLLLRFIDARRQTPFPWGDALGTCRFRVGMERSLAPAWQKEISLLYKACVRVRPLRAT